MAIEVKIPSLGESITEAEVGEWLKREGQSVGKDERLVLIESEKATVELTAPATATLVKILKPQGQVAKVGEVIGILEESKAPAPPPTQKTTEGEPAPSSPSKESAGPEQVSAGKSSPASLPGLAFVMPAAERVIAEHRLSAKEITPSGPGNRILKEDVQRHLEAPPAESKEASMEKSSPAAEAGVYPREEEIVPMTPLRRKVAARLVEAQHAAALLTTVNEIDMSQVMALRNEFGQAFQEKYKTKLGFISFFVKASIESLKLHPQINAEVRGTDVVYRNYYDIGVAIGGGRGLVVPVLRNAERMSFAKIEAAIGDFAQRAKENKLVPDELVGGTFTISNGGVYGSLLSTPIVNPPQSGILGMHAIQDRPVAREGNVVIRPMMYVALTYDHRIVDGREAVTFLRRIKEVIETPARLLLEV
jgi:2-oxoglutarate dehydrogenase E2 component (dihydrolipoamide succinyltransferase)